jgi:hypothetical protein
LHLTGGVSIGLIEKRDNERLLETHDHIVYLYGLVDTALEREIAQSVALETPGVRKVVNSIGISGNR